MSTVQQIDLTAGGNEYTIPITVTAAPRPDGSGTNITSDTYKVSLGSDAVAGTTWVTPQIVVFPVINQAVISVLVGSGALIPTPGTYWLWLKIGDAPETVIRRSDLKLIIV